MRILVHDFAGHPFQAQLSRTFAHRGWRVDHAYCGGVTTGRGDLTSGPSDPDHLSFIDVSDAPFERYAPSRRLGAEARYGRRLARLVADRNPDVVLSANTPLLAQARLWRAGRAHGARRVYWVQDFLGRGTRAVLTERSRALGATLGRCWERLETGLLGRSDAAIVIADEFLDELAHRGVTTPAVTIENWAPLGEIEQRPKRNAWSVRLGIAERPMALYAGTLGLKHDPMHLVATAVAMSGTDQVLVVVTEGRGREVLEEERARRGLHDHLVLLDYVDYATLPDVLGAADVCLVLLEPGAGAFSVPSKVLSYLAAGRPVVAAMPSENLGARTVRRAGAGRVAQPGDHGGFARLVTGLLDDPPTAHTLGAAARAHAESAFAIEPIADRVLEVLGDPSAPLVADGSSPARESPAGAAAPQRAVEALR